MRKMAAEEYAGPAHWLSLAATPTFAVMALLVAAGGDGGGGLHGAAESSPLTGMATMYWLMSLFHAVPWLRWIIGLSSRHAVG